ncbi:MAG: DMT family transporter [Alphaproteobacteria bacterium]|nr:DMT family transporter [Alphaproteobacteria bacterium]
MSSTLSPIHKAMLLSALGYAGFSASDAAVKFLTQYYSIFEIIVLIKLCAGCFLLLLAPLICRGRKLFTTKVPLLHALRGVLNALISIIVVLAFSKLPMTNVYAVLFTGPFFAVLLSIFLYGERLTQGRSIAIAAGFSGVLIAMRPGTAAADPLLLLPLCSAAMAALLFTVSRSLRDESIFSLGFWPVMGAALFCLPLAWPDFIIPTPVHIPLFFISGAGIVTGLLCVSLAFRAAPAASVTPFHYTQIIWGTIYGLLIFGDLPDMWTFAGAAVIIASGLYLVRKERKNIAYRPPRNLSQ